LAKISSDILSPSSRNSLHQLLIAVTRGIQESFCS